MPPEKHTSQSITPPDTTKNTPDTSPRAGIPEDVNAQMQRLAQQVSSPAASASHSHPPVRDIPSSDSSSSQKPPLARPASLLHTYKGDVETMVKKQKLSLIKMAAAQANANKNDLYRLNKKTGKKNASFTRQIPTISLALSLLGLVALGVSYYVYFAPPPPPPSVQGQHSFFFADKVETVDITDRIPTTIKRMLASLRDSSYDPRGSVVQVIPVKTVSSDSKTTLTPLTLRELFTLLKISFPNEYMSSLSDTFMFGWYAAEQKNHPYLILKSSSYDYTFAGMLEWERHIESDFYPLFTLTDSSPLQRFSAEFRFIDSTLDNVDVRILKDPAGKVHVVYGFVTKNLLLVTTDVVPFVEITKRLRTVQ